MTTIAPRRRRVRTRAIVVWSLAALALVLVACAAWVGLRGLQAKDELERIVPMADRFRAAAADRDLDGLQTVSDDLSDAAGRAAGLTGDPVWRVAELVPWIGDDLAAARVASAQLQSVATDAVAPLLTVARNLEDARPEGGGAIDLAVVQQSAEPVGAAAAVLSSARDELAGIDRDALVPQLRDGVTTLATAVGDGADTVTGLADAVTILPGMLGADGPRTLLLMLQNNAELRTGGGITGSFAQLDADAGALSLVAQADSSDFPNRSTAILPVPDAVTTLYGDVVGRFVQNTSMPADFSLSARLASAWWQERTGVTPDAVISIDPLVLRSLLTVTGPATLDDGSELSADNVVQRLLVDPYMNLDRDAQSEFQQQVTSAVFELLLSGAVDPLSWVQGLTKPIAEGRVSVWSAHEAEQSLLTESPLAGPGARHRAAGPDAYAVYLNDLTGAKMDNYLDVGIETGTAACREDGRRDVAVTVTLSSTAPADAGSLPASMTGAGMFGIPAGDIGTIVTVAAPAGTFLGGVSTDGQPTLSADVEDDPASSAARVSLTPGQVSTVEFRFIAAEPGPVSPIILHTPLLNAPTIGESSIVCG